MQVAVDALEEQLARDPNTTVLTGAPVTAVRHLPHAGGGGGGGGVEVLVRRAAGGGADSAPPPARSRWPVVRADHVFSTLPAPALAAALARGAECVTELGQAPNRTSHPDRRATPRRQSWGSCVASCAPSSTRPWPW